MCMQKKYFVRVERSLMASANEAPTVNSAFPCSFACPYTYVGHANCLIHAFTSPFQYT